MLNSDAQEISYSFPSSHLLWVGYNFQASHQPREALEALGSLLEPTSQEC